MTDDLEQSPTLTPPGGGTGASVAKALGLTVAALIGISVLFVLGLMVTYGVQRATPEDYPHVSPEEMAARTTAHSQDAYDALGFDATVEPGEFNSISASACYPDGLESVADTAVEGAYSLNHEWQLVDVPKADALPALRGLRDHLKSKGWEIVSFDPSNSGDSWTLRTQREGEGRMVFDWYEDGGRFYGGAHAECTYDPSRETTDSTLTSDVTAGVDVPALGPRPGR